MGVNGLFKNTFNTFKKKKFQLLAIGIIIMLSSFLYTAMFYAMDSLKTPLEAFIEETNQEDFSIDMINGLTKYDIDELSSEYLEDIPKIMSYSLSNIKKYNEDIFDEIISNRLKGIEEIYSGYGLELREFKEVAFKNKGESHKITLYKDNNVINKSYMEKGKKPEKDNEIAVSTIYGKNNNINIGDTLKINDKEFIVTGFVLFSDNNMPMDIENFIIDNSKITLGLVNDKVYEATNGKENFYISGEFKEGEEGKDELKELKEELDFVLGATLTENQMRSGGIYGELNGGQAMTIGISVCISAIAVMVILIITYKILQNQRIQIGVLKSLGYTNKEILKPYIGLLTIISLPMLLIGYFLGIFASKYMKDLYLAFYLIPDGKVETNVGVLFIAIVVPLVVILGLCALLINKMLSKNAIDLMKVSNSQKVGRLNKVIHRILKKAKPQTKFKYSFILSNTSKFVVFFAGVLFSSMLLILGLMMSNFFDKMALDYYNSVDYVYEAHVDLSKEYPKLEDGEEKFITLPNVVYNDENISLVGIDYNNKLHNLFNKKEDNITEKLKDGAIINASFAMTFGVDKGDKIDLSINDEVHTFKVVEISKDYNGNKVYVDRADLSKIVVKDKDFIEMDEDEFYTGVYSKENLDNKGYITVINKEDILEQSEMLQGFVKVAVYYMIFVAMVMAILILYVLSTMTIEDNYYSISLLKVMGYTKQEINSMMLRSYFTYAIVSYLISVPITYYGMGYGIKYLASEYNIVMPFDLELWHIIVGVIIMGVIFLIGSYAAKKRINNIPLQEVLKEYRE